MLLTFKYISVGMTVYHDGQSHVISRIDDAHNVISKDSTDTAIFCLVPGCEHFRPLFDNLEESLAWESSFKGLLLDPSYSEQNGCWNCKKCFRKSEFDEGYEYFCNSVGDRPPCSSVAMGELKRPEIYASSNIPFHVQRSLYRDLEKQYQDKCDAWETWADKHKVSYSGMCQKWEQK